MNTPDVIYLQWHGDGDPSDTPENFKPVGDEVTWCADKIFEHDVKYLLSTPAREHAEELREFIEQVSMGVGSFEHIDDAAMAAHVLLAKIK